MGTTVNQDEADAAVAAYSISNRGAYHMIARDLWGPRTTSMANPWSKDNPDGMIILRLAENSIMHQEISNFVKLQLKVEATGHLTYSTGPRGSLRLRKAAASLLNEDFKSHLPAAPEDIFVVPGLTSALNASVWSICNPGQGVMIPRPFYNGFVPDIQNRTEAVIVGVTYTDMEGYMGIDDIFAPETNRKALESALVKAKQEGIDVRALIISNPHNPLGRCYPPETLKEMIAFCARNKLHFISDEIYAHSVFQNPSLPYNTPFISAASLDLTDVIDQRQVHILYGASKDFCANGLRLGFLYTKNAGLLGAISSNSQFSWSPHLLQDVWAAMLEDQIWRQSFFTTNLKRMVEHYEVATSFLSEKGIRWLEMNAGLFIWVDLRKFIMSQSAAEATDFSVLHINGTDAAIYQSREAMIIDMCIKNGVMIAPGTAYLAEEYGWFRITFTVPKDALEEGLRRVWTTLEQVQKTGW